MATIGIGNGFRSKPNDFQSCPGRCNPSPTWKKWKCKNIVSGYQSYSTRTAFEIL